ncbi:MAG: spermidine/putrescine transport system permease protein [Chloroflexota bacterium]|jgi:spermidine/putrescine transport system permease protein|nr:spermidine/putrescine transport system permease protein [Chloroflexota bacterium]
MAGTSAAGPIAAGTAGLGLARRRGTFLDRLGRAVDRWLLPLYVLLAVSYLALPVLVMIAFSFNDGGRSNLTWRGFSLDAWLNPLARPGLQDAVFSSLLIAVLATVISTALGVLIGLALVRHVFRGRSAMNLLIFLPMATPEIVMGTSLLTLFLYFNGTFYPLGIHTILIAHVMFNISFVVVTIRARLQGFPRHLEEAAMDLGANEWTTFWKVTFPLILPGVIAAALLAFSLSIDDYVVTSFTAGQTTTFPLYIYGSAQRGIPVQVNVIGTIIFVGAVGLVALSTLLGRRRRLDSTTPTEEEE